jgi:23S rRNA (uracil1939-C5)-methyltransferase
MDLPLIQPIIGANATTAYRNKLEYTFADKRFIPFDEFRALKAKGIEIPESMPTGGFHAKGVFDKVVGIDTCHLQAEPTNDIRNFVVEFCKAHDYPFYNIKSHEGWLRNMMVRLATTGELMINLVVGFENKKMKTQLLDAMLEKFPAITTLLYTVNTKFNDSMFGLVPQTYFGNGYIIEQLSTKNNAKTYSFKISPKSFFQTNTKQAEQLYRITADYAALTGNETVYDLYCGTGSIGIFVSDKAKKIIGVEQVEEAIIDAKENAALNNIEHSFFTAGDVIDICNDDFFASHGKPDVVITDPPRAGMHEKLVQKLLDIAAPLIVYVSCNPATQARDLALLSEKYDVTALQPVDMFPHTHHIENVAQLKLRN